ncbi:MAG TPA: hypothetical protein VK403_05460, partial [Allosphingosinicella sp.]|nr:hypothetical protein [Allosphingosinicella sp.]
MQGGTTNFCKDGSQTSCFLLPSEISTPDGRTVTLDWNLNERCASFFNPDGSLDCQYDWRLGGVSNNFGYSIGFSYTTATIYGQPPASWYQRTGASFYNFNLGTAAQASVAYSYPSGGVTDVTDIGGRVWRVSPGRIRRPGATADTTIVSTNTSGTVSAVTNEGVTTGYNRTVSGNAATMIMTNALNQATTIVSNINISRPTSITDPLNRTTGFQYDTAGQLTRVTAPEGNYVAYTHDSRGNVTATTAVPKGGTGPAIVTSATYASSCAGNVACNRPASTTDARGNTTDYDWDPDLGVLNSVTAPAPSGGPDRPQTRFAYTIDPDSGRYQLTGTSQCRAGSAPSCVGTADEVKTIIAYNADGSVASTQTGDGSGALTATSAMTYNALGDLLTVDGPLPGTGDTSRFRYNSARELVGTVSPDPDGTGPLKPRAVRNSYTNGLLTKVEQGNVDSQSDAHWAAFAPAQAVETDYEHARPVTSRLVSGSTVHALSQTSYDPLGRPDCTVQRMNPAAFAGTLPAACVLGTQGSGANDHGPDRIAKSIYDLAGRVEQVKTALGVTGQEANEVTTTYTDNGLVHTVTDAESNKTTYEYDGHDRLLYTRYPLPAKGANASAPTSGNGADYEQLTYETFASGTRTSGLVTAFRNRAGETIGFGHDALGRQISKDRPGTEPDVAYGYDLLGRMTSASQ